MQTIAGIVSDGGGAFVESLKFKRRKKLKVFEINYKDEIVEVSFDRETTDYYWRGKRRYFKKSYDHYSTYKEALEAKKKKLSDRVKYWQNEKDKADKELSEAIEKEAKFWLSLEGEKIGK